MKKTALFLSFLTMAGLALGSADLGEFSYLTESTSITRDGRTWEADFGSGVENYDTIRTDLRGTAEIGVYPETGIDGSIRILPNTALYLDLSSLRQGSQARVELLSGSISARVNKLAGRSAFTVRSQGVAMGVRGTKFDILTLPSGDLLTTCEEGSVLCIDEDGRQLVAEPGQAVEKTADGIFQNIPVRVSELEAFRRNWNLEKIEALQANAGSAIGHYALRFVEMKDSFDQAYRELQLRREILDKWFREDSRKTLGTRIEIMREKTALMPSLMKLRGSLFIFERVFYRLLELQDYHSQGYGAGYVDENIDADRFFRSLEIEARDLENRMGTIRYILKLYAKRNDGVSLFDDLLGGENPEDGGPEGIDDFFGESSAEDDFFGI